jgi:hypothetical protein
VGIGHVALGIGLKSADRRLNAGILIFAALLADFLLGWFVLAGWESYRYPADYDSAHYMLFTFPWSHGLVPLALWSGLLAFLWWLFRRDRRAAMLIGVAALSHFLLDGIVHIQGLPLAGPGTYEFGLGLWRLMPLALGIGAAMAVAAMVLHWRDNRRIGMLIYVVVLGAVTIAGQATAAGQAPGNGLIASWIAVPVVFAAIAGWLDRTKQKPSSV